MADPPVVKVWKPGAAQWELCALPITDYDDLNADLRHLDFGSWSMTLPAGHPAVEELARADAWHSRLVTIDYADRLAMTGLVADRERARSADDDVFTVGGSGALALLSWPLAWPVPTAALSAQGTQTRDAFPADGGTDAPAEDVVRYFVAANFRDRWAADKPWPAPVVAPSQGRGANLRGKTRMRTLWRVVQPLARRGGIGITVALAPTTPTRADLHVDFYQPTDRTAQARLSEDIGALRSWQSSQGAPGVTRAIVGDAGVGAARTFVSRAQGGTWIEVFVNADDTFDPVELNQRGDEALDEGSAQAAFTLEAEDSELVRYGHDYGLGDLVTVQVGRATAVDHVNSVVLAVGDDGVRESPIVGDPDKPDPLFRLGRILRATARKVDRAESKT